MFRTPILLLIFNRPDTTEQVFERIRQIRPTQLYVAADGPRSNKDGETEKCEKARSIIDRIDWDCEVKTLFREENLGCGIAVSQAITWFFNQVEQGIILEDDCLPHIEFFLYSQELLDKYKEDHTVMLIGGSNFQDGVKRGEASYYFSAISHIWGWATWRSTWELYDYNLNAASRAEYLKSIYHLFNRKATRYLSFIFDRMKNHEISTWDYQLGFSIWLNKGLSIIPNVNLVTNIGFGPEGTHIKKKR